MVPIFRPCCWAKRRVGHARHGAVIVHDLADDAGGIETGEPGEVDGGFGVTGAHQHAAFARDQREDMARRHDVLDALVGSMASAMVRARSCAEMPVVMPSRASMETVNAVRLRASFWRAIDSSRSWSRALRSG